MPDFKIWQILKNAERRVFTCKDRRRHSRKRAKLPKLATTLRVQYPAEPEAERRGALRVATGLSLLKMVGLRLESDPRQAEQETT